MNIISFFKFKVLATTFIFVFSLLISGCDAFDNFAGRYISRHKSDKNIIEKFQAQKPEVERMLQIIKNYEQTNGSVNKVYNKPPYKSLDEIMGKEFKDQHEKLNDLGVATWVTPDCFFSNNVCFEVSEASSDFNVIEHGVDCHHVVTTNKTMVWVEGGKFPDAAKAEEVESLDDYDAHRYEKLEKYEPLAAYRHVEGNWYLYYSKSHDNDRCDGA